MKINNIVGNFHLNAPFPIDIAYDTLSLASESEIVILKLKNEKKIKNKKYLKHNSEKNAFNNSLQVILVCKMSFKFFKNGRIHASGFQNIETAFEKLYFILNLLEKCIPKEPVLVRPYENKNGILFYTNENNSTFIIGKDKDNYIHKARVFLCVKTYKTIRKQDKAMQIELCDPVDDCKQVVFDKEKNLFYADTHLKSRCIFNNHLNFIGMCHLQFIDGYRRNLPRFDKFYIEDDKLYFKSTKEMLPFALLRENIYGYYYEKHDNLETIYLSYPSGTFDKQKIKFETDLLNIKETIGQPALKDKPIDKVSFYNCLLRYSDKIDVKYNPNNYSGIRFEYLPFQIKGQIHGNRVNLSCKLESEAFETFEFLKEFYKLHFEEFTRQFSVHQNFEELSIFDVYEKIF